MCLLVSAAVWRIASHSELPLALAAAIIGGILIGRHAYNADLVLLIPALWIVCQPVPGALIRTLAAALLLPFLFMLQAPHFGSMTVSLLPLLMLLLLFALVYRSGSLPRMKPDERE